MLCASSQVTTAGSGAGRNGLESIEPWCGSVVMLGDVGWGGFA